MAKLICAIMYAHLLFLPLESLAGPGNDRWAYSGIENKAEDQNLSYSGKLFPEAHHSGAKGYSIYFKSDSGETYDVVRSPEIRNLFKNEERIFVVNIEGELTPKFLFWGGNLVIKSFTILGKKPAPQHVVSSTTEWLDRGRVR